MQLYGFTSANVDEKYFIGPIFTNGQVGKIYYPGDAFSSYYAYNRFDIANGTVNRYSKFENISFVPPNYSFSVALDKGVISYSAAGGFGFAVISADISSNENDYLNWNFVVPKGTGLKVATGLGNPSLTSTTLNRCMLVNYPTISSFEAFIEKVSDSGLHGFDAATYEYDETSIVISSDVEGGRESQKTTKHTRFKDTFKVGNKK